MSLVTVDFIAHATETDPWSMILVEQGPWCPLKLDAHLRLLQERLYGCVDAALDGKFAEVFPDAQGKPILIRVDGYNLPETPVRAFFDRFARSVFCLPDYAAALAGNSFVAGIDFELSIDRL